MKLPNLDIQKAQVEAFNDGLNPSALVNGEGWEKPAPNDIRLVLKLAGFTGSNAAKLLKISPRTIRKWTGGDQSIPFAAWCLLVERAGLGEIWK